jgi:SAM-dependent methyltransferase
MKVVEKSRLMTLLGFIAILFCTVNIAFANQWDHYFQSISHKRPEPFIVSGLKKIPDQGNGKIAIDLGASIGHETALLLQKGYKVIAVDSNAYAFKYMLQQPGIAKYQSHLTTINTSFEHLDFSTLPKSDLVISSFALPFVGKSDFNRVWNNIAATVKPGGYVIINLFAPGFTFPNTQKDMTFHTKQEALALFKNFKIIEFREMRNDPRKPGKDKHFYVIIAKKLH